MAEQPFGETDASKLLVNAVQFLGMAKLVTDTPYFRRHPRQFNRPLLDTLAVGVELFLKSAHVAHGKSLTDAKAYGHRISRLWDECPDSRIRDRILLQADRCFDEAIAEGLENAKPADLSGDFVASLQNLSELHSTAGSLNRYLAPPGTMATRPGSLICTFEIVAMDCYRAQSFEPWG